MAAKKNKLTTSNSPRFYKVCSLVFFALALFNIENLQLWATISAIFFWSSFFIPMFCVKRPVRLERKDDLRMQVKHLIQPKKFTPKKAAPEETNASPPDRDILDQIVGL